MNKKSFIQQVISSFLLRLLSKLKRLFSVKLPSLLNLIVNYKEIEFDEDRWSLLAWVLDFNDIFMMKLRKLQLPNNIKVTIYYFTLLAGGRRSIFHFKGAMVELFSLK